MMFEKVSDPVATYGELPSQIRLSGRLFPRGDGLLVIHAGVGTKM